VILEGNYFAAGLYDGVSIAKVMAAKAFLWIRVGLLQQLDRAPADRWYVCAVAPQAEASVARRAEELSITTYYPTGRKYVRARRRRVVVMEPRQTPAMPGYVFVHGAHFSNFRRDFDAPEAVPHCIGWLNGADGPEPVSSGQIAELRQRASTGEFDAVVEAQGRYWAPRWLRPRAKVRITAGALTGQFGEFWRMTTARRVQLWVQMLGQLTLAEVDLDAVARAR
jgi:transcription antitermination factor NusG